MAVGKTFSDLDPDFGKDFQGQAHVQFRKHLKIPREGPGRTFRITN